MVDKQFTRLLVADDVLSLRAMLRTMLKQIGFKEVMLAENGRVALSKIKKHNINFVISDWNMPNGNGIELLTSMRADQFLKDVPFLMMTANSELAFVQEALGSGASGYVTKPFTPETLENKIDELLLARKAR